MWETFVGTVVGGETLATEVSSSVVDASFVEDFA
jgi:hypothetical protein